MRYAFIDQYRRQYRIRVMCRLLQVGVSSYYHWRSKSSAREERTKHQGELVFLIRYVHSRSREIYGSPRIQMEIRALGVVLTERRIAELMRQEGICGKPKKKKYRPGQKPASTAVGVVDLVRRRFIAHRPNELWTGDITYIWTTEGWLYLAVVLDVFHRSIVGVAMSDRMTAALPVAALEQAALHRLSAREEGTSLIIHNDLGSQYRSERMQQVVERLGARHSFSGKGSCYDNAITESFFHTLKTELIHERRYRTREEARKSIFEYIMIFYNQQRRHSALGYLSPAEFEAKSLT